jgi:diguanylate cyclase (GGDEF)-like protein/PAS domain S-box-containing protein
MREALPPSDKKPFLLPEHLLHSRDGQFTQLLFDSLHSSILCTDQWGSVIAANSQAKALFNEEDLIGKTILELFQGWDDPLSCHHELLKVGRTGVPVFGSVEKAIIGDKQYWFQTDKVCINDEKSGIQGVLMTLDDITTVKQHEINLEEKESRLRAFVENSQDAIWCFDINPPIPVSWPQNLIIEEINNRAKLDFCNDQFTEIYNEGLSSGSPLMHSSVSSSDSSTVPLQDSAILNNILDVDVFVEREFKIYGKESICKSHNEELTKYLQVSANGSVQNGHLTEIWGMSRDISERRLYIQRLEYQANHDLLTGLPNRRHLQESVNTAIDLVEPGQELALMIIDLNGFKEINDTLGHHTGDAIIKEIAQRIRRRLTGLNSTVARLGGDEFAIFLNDFENEEHVLTIARRIMGNVRKELMIEDLTIDMRASLGIAMYPEQAKDYTTLMRFADVAMYNAKKSGNSVELYDAEKDQHSPKRLSLMNDLGKAIRENQLSVYYQPKVCLHTGRVMGVEALARWNHPELGYISPSEFIPIAEMSELISDITEWMLNESLHQVSQWKKMGLSLKVAVNISARNLLDESIVNKIEWLLSRYQLSPSSLELEITETTIMKNADYALSLLTEINQLGVELSIDDFGTGYSSLAYLKKLPVKYLKIDYAFIINMLEDEQDQIIVNSTINMAHNLGLSVVAEGVENKEILNKLSTMRCEQAQGYYFARPMPAKRFEFWYQNFMKDAS